MQAFQEVGNGTRTHYEYDAADRRLAVLETGEFQRLHYDYDRVGNVTSLANQVQDARPNEMGGRVQQTFHYDDLHRLTDASGTWRTPQGKRNQYTYSLQYDDIHDIRHKAQRHWVLNGNGNHDIVQHETTYDWAYDYHASVRPHAPEMVGTRRFHYDLDGNQTGWDETTNGLRRTIVWDEEQRPRQISYNGRTTYFVYDAGGDRVIKRGAQGETVYVNPLWTVRNGTIGTKHIYMGSSRVTSKLSPGSAHIDPNDEDLVAGMLGRWYEHRSDSGHDSGSNTEHNPHYRVPSALPAMGLPETNFVYFYHADHLGSTSYVTDPEGELYEHVQYFPSGEAWADERSNTERLPYLFTGKELDQETGLYDFGARLYDPRVGLWASTDPAEADYLDGGGPGGIFNPSLLSTYAFAGNNTLTYKDPDGNFWHIVGGAALGAAISGGLELASQLSSGGVDLGKIGSAMSGGAVAGGMMAASAGVGALASAGQVMLAGGLSNAAGGLTTRMLNGDGSSVEQVATDAFLGAVSAGVANEVGRRFLTRAAAGGASQVCFAAGTLVATEEGLRPIEEVDVGDRVWARDDETGEEGWKLVTEVFVTPDRELLELTFEAADGTTQVLRVTAEHPLWSLDDGEWDSAANLDVGESVDTLHGTMRLISVVTPPSTETVYNFEVADSHTYFVGDAGIWVHNTCPKVAMEAVRRGQGPKGITRIDRPDPRYPHTQWEAHTGGRGSPDLLRDGTWKRVPEGTSPPSLPRKTLEWLREHGWEI